MSRPALVTHAAFAAFGVFWGAWAATLPALQLQTGASKATLGLALAFLTVGAVPAMILAGRAVDRFGGPAIAATCAVFAVTAALPGLAHSVAVLAVILAATGAGSGAFDVAINARASRLEKETGANLFPSSHGFYAVGVVVGAVAAGIARGAGAHTEGVLAASAVLIFAISFLLRGGAGEHAERARVDIRRTLLVLGAIGAACAICESGLENWSALFLERTFHAHPAVSGLAPGLFGAAMAVGRFSGHALRIADVPLFAGGVVVAAAGFVVAAAAPDIPVALVGFAVGGAGISLTAPLLFRAAGRVGGGSGGAIATMTTLTYGGFVLGPPAIGGVAQLGGLRTAFVTLAVLATVVAAATALLGALRPSERP